MDAKIEHDVPLPPKVYGRWVVLLEALEPGDSFAVPLKHEAAIASRASLMRKQGRGSFQTRRLVKNGERIVRCWRIQ